MTEHPTMIGRRALVTGSSRGTGAAIAARLREAGATVLATARSEPDRPGLFVSADATTTDGVSRIVDAVRQELGGIPWAVRSCPRRSPNWWPSSSPAAPPPSPARSTPSTAAPCRPSDLPMRTGEDR